jgi:DNA modification methylase
MLCEILIFKGIDMKKMLNKIMYGDCLKVMKDIPDKSVDMILCDLPLDKRITI